MPAEKFYPPTAVEGQDGDHLAIAWGGRSPSVVIDLKVAGLNGGFPLDRSGINRMIRALRRARDATYGADE